MTPSLSAHAWTVLSGIAYLLSNAAILAYLLQTGRGSLVLYVYLTFWSIVIFTNVHAKLREAHDGRR